jgi:hypothetical protein
MAVVKAASMTSEGKSLGGGIYHGGPSKAHLGSSSSLSSSAGQRMMTWRTAGSGGITVGAVMYITATLL